jgi:hypothetical protein
LFSTSLFVLVATVQNSSEATPPSTMPLAPRSLPKYESVRFERLPIGRHDHFRDIAKLWDRTCALSPLRSLLGLGKTLKVGSALAGQEGMMQPTAELLRMRTLATFKKQLCSPRSSWRCRSEVLVSDRGDGRPSNSRLLDAFDSAPTRPAGYDPRPTGLNIGLPLAVADAGTSSCNTSQCSTSLPFNTRKISTATIGFGPHPT